MGITEDYAQLVEEEGEDAAAYEFSLLSRRYRPEVELGSEEYERGEDLATEDRITELLEAYGLADARSQYAERLILDELDLLLREDGDCEDEDE